MTMLEKDPSMPWCSPMLIVKDVDASVKKYAAAFGFEPGGSMKDEDGRTNYANMMYKGQTVLMMMPEQSWGSPAVTPNSSNTPTPVTLYIYVDNVDEQFEQAKQAGITVLSQPEDMMWGDRVTQLQDDDGHVWSVATRIAEYETEQEVTA
ncbi:MAG: VOC family protein [Gammaproteobacteria bacterium]|nr:VOC family protein [Gammaproteobacteria bacterium]